MTAGDGNGNSAKSRCCTRGRRPSTESRCSGRPWVHRPGLPAVDDLDYDPSAAKTFCVGRSVNPVGFDKAPLAPRSPVAIEVRVCVLRIFLLMLLPAGIVEINAVGGFVILALKRGEELVHAVLLRPVAVHPGQRGQSDYDHHRHRDLDLPPPRRRGVVGMGVEQGHKSPSSITDSRRIQDKGRRWSEGTGAGRSSLDAG